MHCSSSVRFPRQALLLGQGMIQSELALECQYCSMGTKLAPPLQLALAGHWLQPLLELKEKEAGLHGEQIIGLVLGCHSPSVHARTVTSMDATWTTWSSNHNLKTH